MLQSRGFQSQTLLRYEQQSIPLHVFFIHSSVMDMLLFEPDDSEVILHLFFKSAHQLLYKMSLSFGLSISQ